MDERTVCPLGSVCYEIRDNIPRRCAWHIRLKGMDALGEEHDRWGCAIAWFPLLQVEVAQTNRGQTAAIESMRNEHVKRIDQAMAIRLLENENH